MEKAWMVVVTLLTMTALLAGCMTEELTRFGSQSDPAEAVPAAPAQEASAEPEVKEFHVEAFRFSFDPNVIEVNQGDVVRIIAVSTDVAHGLAIPEYGVNLRLEPGVEQVAEFVAGTPGEFTFYCNVPCGPGHGGMRGTLKVN